MITYQANIPTDYQFFIIMEYQFYNDYKKYH